MKIPVVFLSLNPETPARGYWDMGMLEDVFSGKMWKPATSYEFVVVDKLEDAGEGAIIVFPARAQVDYLDELNARIKPLKWVVLMLTGDEEASFPVEKVKHPNIFIWVMSPRPDRHEAYNKLGTGYPPQAREWLPKYQEEAQERPIDYFFSGQITHDRRWSMSVQLRTMVEFKHANNLRGDFNFTDGFTKGYQPEEYYKRLARAKTAPAPSGPETPDSFRLFEALEAGCIPIADTRDPKGVFPDNYWQWFFEGDVPFPIIKDYEQELQGFTIAAVKDFAKTSNDIFAWWQNYKRDLCYRVMKQVHILRGDEGTYFPRENANQSLTVIIPTSVIPAHPSTAILEETIEAVRTQLPDAEIIITFDGVRDKQKNRKADYELYMRKALWLCNNKWHNVLPVIFRTHEHQASMLRKVLPKVRTPYILYVEHDAPVVPDRIIEWEKLIGVMDSGEADIIRFHHEELVLPDHEHMMIDHYDVQVETTNSERVSMRRTAQWSQRPHIARVSFYERILDNYFHPDSKTMIEDVMHGVVHQEFEKHGAQGWYNFRLWLYCPTTDKLGIKRSYHTDGRGADPKYEMDIKPVEGKH